MAEADHTIDDSILFALLKTSDTPAAVKAVFVDDTVDDSIKQLKGFMRQKERTIEDKCSFHYQGFYKSIDQLWAVKQEFELLKENVAKLNTKVQATGRLVLSTSEELARKRKILQRIDETTAVIETAKMSIGLLERAYRQIEESQFYPALKSIHLLEVSLKPVADYAIAQLIGERIEPMVFTITKSVWSQFVDWAEKSTADGGDSEEVGGMAMAMARLKIMDETYDDEEADIQRVDICAVSRCLHVYHCLQKADEFKQEYIKCRQTHIHNMLHIKHATKAGGDWREAPVDWTKYYAKIVGFFAIEDTIHRANNEEFTSGAEVEELWGSCVQDVIGNLKDRIPKLAPEKHLALKRETEVFCAAMKDLGPLFRSTAVMEFIDQTVKSTEGSAKLKSKLENDLRNKMKQQFKGDDFKPLRFTKKEDLKKAMDSMGLTGETPRDLRSFALPVSKTVPELCGVIKNYFRQFAAFMDRDEETGYLDAADVRKAQRTLSDEMAKLLDGHIADKINSEKDPSQKVKKAVFTYINMLWIQGVFARHLDERFLVDECAAPPDMRMTLESELVVLRTKCKELVLATVTKGADNLIQRGSSVQWDLAQERPAGKMNEYMTAVIEHLKMLDDHQGASLLASESNIRDSMLEDRQYLEKDRCRALIFARRLPLTLPFRCQAIFAGINSSIVKMITSARIPKISKIGVRMLGEDIKGLAKELGAWLSADRRPKHLEQIFGGAEASQLCDIVLKDDIENLQDDDTRLMKYKSVEVYNIIEFLQKYSATLDTNMFGFAGADKQVCDNTVKYLRTLKEARKPRK